MTTNKFLMNAGLALSALGLLVTPVLAGADMINRQLEVGDRGTDVSAMQAFFATDVSIYPQGLVTGYFGFLTKVAVANFQSRNGLPSVGRVGPMTLPVLNAQMAGIPNNSSTDMSAPIIRSVSVSTSNNSATVSWSMSDVARTKLYYSTSPIVAYNSFDATGANFVEPNVSGTVAVFDNNYRSSNSVAVGSLSANTIYYYLIVALDGSNNVGVSAPAYFRTSL